MGRPAFTAANNSCLSWTPIWIYASFLWAGGFLTIDIVLYLIPWALYMLCKVEEDIFMLPNCLWNSWHHAASEWWAWSLRLPLSVSHFLCSSVIFDFHPRLFSVTRPFLSILIWRMLLTLAWETPKTLAIVYILNKVGDLLDYLDPNLI